MRTTFPNSANDSAMRFQVSCSWADGVTETTIADLIQNNMHNVLSSDELELIWELREAAIGETVTFEQAFNGQEYFKRIA